MKILRIPLYLLAMGLLSACEDYVDVDLPGSQLTGVTVFEDRNTANAAMTEVYTKLRETGFLSGTPQGSSAAFGLYADELTYFGGSGVSGQFLYLNALLPSTGQVSTMWNESYHQIYLANAVLQGVEQSASLTDAEKAQLRGEALFVRALVHFYLVNTFGDVPYITTTDYQQNSLVLRMPTERVYEKIANDLQEAATLLPQDYYSANRTRPNTFAARALLARTYLYMGLWAEAANEASSVLNSALYAWETDLSLVFLKESGSTIWQLQPATNGLNTNEAATFTFTSVPPPNLAVSQQLISAFEVNDARKIQWLASVTNGADTFYHSCKYKVVGNTGTSEEYSVVLRLAEQYFIRSEARARQGDIIGAREDLNKVRNRAGLTDTTAFTIQELIDAVMRERRVELFTEHGHRFFDLKRNGILDSSLSPVKTGWDTTDRLWPLPETELLANPNLLPQNQGY